MGYISDLFKKNGYIFVFIILAYLTLFALRGIDDNRLVSWQWVFDGVSIGWFFLGVLAALLAALMLSKEHFIERNPVFFLFVSSFIISSFFWRQPEAIVDASRYFTQAKHLEVYGMGYFIKEWGSGINAWTDMPLVPFIYGLIFRFFGESRVYIQIFTSSCFSLTVVLAFLVGKRLWSKHFGLYAGILLMGIPYLYSQIPLMLVDVPTMFFFMLSVFFFMKALDNGGAMILASSVATALALFTKYSVWLLMPVLPLTAYALMKETRNQNFIYRGLLPLLTACILALSVFIYKFDFFCEQFGFLLTYQVPGLKKWGESFISTFFFQTSPLITFALLYSAYAAFKERDKKYFLIILPVLLVIVFQIHRIRYTIVVFPMLCMAASYGLSRFRDKESAIFISLSAAFLSVIVALFFYIPFVERISAVNLKDAGRFLDTIDADYAEVITLPLKDTVVNPAVAVPLLDLFTKKDILYDYKPEFNKDEREIKESSLRFTWEYRNPGYYALKSNGKKKALVVISGERDFALPESVRQKAKGFQRSRAFDKSIDIFRHRTFVSVYFD